MRRLIFALILTSPFVGASRAQGVDRAHLNTSFQIASRVDRVLVDTVMARFVFALGQFKDSPERHRELETLIEDVTALQASTNGLHMLLRVYSTTADTGAAKPFVRMYLGACRRTERHALARADEMVRYSEDRFVRGSAELAKVAIEMYAGMLDYVERGF